MIRLRRILGTLVVAGALLATPVFAQEEGKKAEAAESSSEKPGMEIWKWLNFAILAGILGWLTAKNMGPALATRSQQIQEGLKAGEKAKAEADARAAAVTAQLAGLGTAIAAMKDQAKQEREREAARILRETELELQRIRQHATFEIESAGKLARLDVQRQAARLALELAEQKVRARMSADTQSGLVGNFIGSLAGESDRQGLAG